MFTRTYLLYILFKKPEGNPQTKKSTPELIIFKFNFLKSQMKFYVTAMMAMVISTLPGVQAAIYDP